MAAHLVATNIPNKLMKGLNNYEKCQLHIKLKGMTLLYHNGDMRFHLLTSSIS